jgi:1,4-alpha-glucan branching enzyme
MTDPMGDNMLQKRRFKKENVTKVTFVLPADVVGDTVHVVGEFNEWQTSRKMKKQKDNGWRLTLSLKPGGEYEFRYLLNERDWFNDPEADRFVPNPFGELNSVVAT